MPSSSAPGDTEEPLLRVAHLERHFGGVRAVSDVSFELAPGDIHGLIGPNGSGKTTSINLISGAIRANAGSVRLDGREIAAAPPHRINRLGIARTYQQVRLFPEMTALENVMAGQYNARHLRGSAPDAGPARFGLRAGRARRDHARELLHRVGVERNHDVKAEKLGFLDRHLVEVARAMATAPRVLLLDEPTTGMVSSEVEILERLVNHLAATGIAVLIVEHNMALVMRMCLRLTVLNFGRVIAEGEPAAVSDDPVVIEAYLGTGRN